MPCDRRLKPQQTIEQRKTEIRSVVDRTVKALVSGKVKAVVSPQGAIAFDGISDKDRDGVTDNCLYRRLLTSGSALALAQLAKAEQLAGRKVDRMVVGGGTHSHDGGKTFHTHKG